MSADDSFRDRDPGPTSPISRREVLLTIGGVAGAIGAGAAAWGVLEFLVSKQHVVGGGVNVSYVQVVEVLGTLVCVAGVILCIRTARVRFDAFGARLVALLALIVLPAGAVLLGNYHTFEGVHEVNACASCHVMLPMVNDMRNPASETLAAVHYKNKYIAEDQCYHCHSDYGLGGDLEAKMTGFRHLARYTTRTYTEPIKARVKVNNTSCLHCHEGTPKWIAVEPHIEARKDLVANQTMCIDCHGDAHPTPAQRTPGSSDYARLMEKTK
jgi:cytochrome c nitrite reductase small subunit